MAGQEPGPAVGVQASSNAMIATLFPPIRPLFAPLNRQGDGPTIFLPTFSAKVRHLSSPLPARLLEENKTNIILIP